MDDDRRDPNRQIFRDLHVAIERLEGGLQRLLPLLEKVAVLTTRVDGNEAEINRIRDRLEGPTAPTPAPVQQGSVSLRALSIIVSIVGILVTILLKLADWAVGTLNAAPPPK